MSLLSRLIRLEGRVKAPAVHTHVIFQKDDESDEKVLKEIESINCEPEDMLIVVKFVDSKRN